MAGPPRKLKLKWPYVPRGSQKPRKGGEPEPVPAEPKNPKPLSGGAAAELEFDE